MISFIAPAHNEAQLLGRTLAALREAAAEVAMPTELIVVDDASTDATARIAAEHGARVISVAYRQIARVRNAGARAASGTLLVFVDADTVVPPATLRATLRAVEQGAVGGGAVLHFDGPLPRWWRASAWMLTGAMRLGRLAAGAYLFCTRAAFEATGGFDERLFVTEELVLSRALQRVGRVVVLREGVHTSGRKFRTHPVSGLVRPLLALARRGPVALRRREGLELWYGPRRPDPGGDGGAS
jgi:glycosyltransferase involved in cell wall biosynthesis